MSMCRVISFVVEKGVCYDQHVLLPKLIRLCPASFGTPRPNLPITPGISWLPTFAFQSPMMKVQFSTVAQSCPTLCNPMNHSTPGLPVHHQLPEFTQTHIHWVNDAIQLFHPLLSPSPPTFNLSQHQGQFFASGGQSIGVSVSTSVLPMNTQDCSPLGWTDWISLQSKGLSRVFSNTTVQKHQFFGTQLCL